MSAQHTPGPWKAIHNLIYRERFSSPVEGMTSIARVHLRPRARVLNATEEANARLIAAAPDLLAACETRIGRGHSAGCDWIRDARRKNRRCDCGLVEAEAAVAKARPS